MNTTDPQLLAGLPPVTAAENDEFSQVARQTSSPSYPEKTRTERGPTAEPQQGDVALRSKSACRPVAEKILSEHQHLLDIATLTKMELRQRYSVEASTHRNMLSRERKRGNIIHADFRGFASFLRHVGPIPAHGATLDRIDNADPEYGPRKVRWADKRTQNGNKGDTLIFYYSRTGETYTSSRLAALRNVSASTIRKRRERGWTDDEIIEGVCVRLSPQPARPQVNAPRTSSPHPVTATQLVRRPETHAERTFREMRDYFAAHRLKHGEEAIPAIYGDAVSAFEMPIPKAGFDKHYAKIWPRFRPHVVFANLSQAEVEYLQGIDPVWVSQQRDKITQLERLRTKL